MSQTISVYQPGVRTSNLSLYRIISKQFKDELIINTTGMMRSISNQIENAVRDNKLSVDFFAGFQRYSSFQEQADRYREVTKTARRGFIFGVPDVPEADIPGLQYIPLTEHDPLYKEWFIVINEPYFHTALIAREMDSPDPLTGSRRFEGLWTYDERVVNQAHLLLCQYLGLDIEPIYKRDYKRHNQYVASIANNLVNQMEHNQVANNHHQRLYKAMNLIAQTVGQDYDLDELLETTVSNLYRSFEAHTVTIWQASTDLTQMRLLSGAGLPAGWQRNDQIVEVDSSQHLAAKAIRQGKISYIPHTKKKRITDPYDLSAGSIVAVPLYARGQVVGALQITDPRPHAYNQDSLQILQSFCAHLGGALYEATQERPALPGPTKAVYDSVDTHISVLDKAGNIISVNESWTEFGAENSNKVDAPPDNTNTGVNYLEICQQAIGEDRGDEALEVYEGIKAVLDGRQEQFELEYPCHSPTEERYFLVRAVPLSGEEGAVVSHINVTGLKKSLQHNGQTSTLSSIQPEVVDSSELMARLRSLDKLVNALPSLGNLSSVQAEALNRINQLRDEMNEIINEKNGK